MKQLTAGWRKAKSPFPKLRENSQTEVSASSATDRNFPPQLYTTLIVNVHRSIKIKPQNSEQATKTMELG